MAVTPKLGTMGLGLPWVALVLLTLVCGFANASVTVLSGSNAGDVYQSTKPFQMKATFNTTGNLMQLNLTSGCSYSGSVPPNTILLVLFDQANGADCFSYEDIIYNVLVNLDSCSMIIGQSKLAPQAPGFTDFLGGYRRYMYLNASVSIITFPDSLALADTLQSNGNVLQVQVVSDVGAFIASITSPLYTASRVIFSIVYGVLFLYSGTMFCLVVYNQQSITRISSVLYLFVFLFTILRFIPCVVDFEGFVDYFGLCGQFALFWVAYYFGYCSVCTLLYGWTSAIRKTRTIPKWLKTVFNVYLICSLVFFAIGIIMIVVWYSQLKLNTLALVMVGWFFLIGVLIFVLCLVFLVAGGRLLVIFYSIRSRETSLAEIAKDTMSIKVTVLMVLTAFCLLSLTAINVSTNASSAYPVQVSFVNAWIEVVATSVLITAMMLSLSTHFYDRRSGQATMNTTTTTAARSKSPELHHASSTSSVDRLTGPPQNGMDFDHVESGFPMKRVMSGVIANSDF